MTSPATPPGAPATDAEPCDRRCRLDGTGQMHTDCAHRAAADLADLPALYARLWTILPAVQTAGARVTGSKDRPLVIQPHVHDLMTDIRDILKSWADQIADTHPGELKGTRLRPLKRIRRFAVGPSGDARVVEQRDRDLDANRVLNAVLWIQARQWWPYCQAWSADFAEEIRTLAHTARKLAKLYDEMPGIKNVPCRCGRLTLVQYPGEDDVRCARADACGLVLRPAEYQAWRTEYLGQLAAAGQPTAETRAELLARSAVELSEHPQLRGHSNRLATRAGTVLEDPPVTTPTTPPGLRQYDGLDAVDAVAAAWTRPGPSPEWHEQSRARVRQVMPLLARALDRLAEEAAAEASRLAALDARLGSHDPAPSET